MYSIQKAAVILGIGKQTVRDWMKRLGVEGKIVKTDRRRRYLTDSDMVTLAGHANVKAEKRKDKKRKRKGENKEMRDNRDYKYYYEDKNGRFYSFSGAAASLGVSTSTVKRWIIMQGIETKLITKDKRRAYIAYADVMRLAEVYERKLVEIKTVKALVQQEESATEAVEEKDFYTIMEAALALNASENSLKRWIRQHHIVKMLQVTDRERVYIAYKDILTLAELHNRKLVANPAPVSVEEEIKEIKGILKRHDADIEDIKHDIRLLAKRSVYIGRS